MNASFLGIVVLTIFLYRLSEARRPNPCSFPEKRSCKGTRICAAAKLHWGWRKAICVARPHPRHSCSCDEALDETVCCRIVTSRYRQRVVMTIESKACMCENCLLGNVLFRGNCSQPPSHKSDCDKNGNTCCYISELDLTFSASSRCACNQARNGQVIPSRFCRRHSMKAVTQ